MYIPWIYTYFPEIIRLYDGILDDLVDCALLEVVVDLIRVALVFENHIYGR